MDTPTAHAHHRASPRKHSAKKAAQETAPLELIDNSNRTTGKPAATVPAGDVAPSAEEGTTSRDSLSLQGKNERASIASPSSRDTRLGRSPRKEATADQNSHHPSVESKESEQQQQQQQQPSTPHQKRMGTPSAESTSRTRSSSTMPDAAHTRRASADSIQGKQGPSVAIERIPSNGSAYLRSNSGARGSPVGGVAHRRSAADSTPTINTNLYIHAPESPSTHSGILRTPSAVSLNSSINGGTSLPQVNISSGSHSRKATTPIGSGVPNGGNSPGGNSVTSIWSPFHISGSPISSTAAAAGQVPNKRLFSGSSGGSQRLSATFLGASPSSGSGSSSLFGQPSTAAFDLNTNVQNDNNNNQPLGSSTPVETNSNSNFATHGSPDTFNSFQENSGQDRQFESDKPFAVYELDEGRLNLPEGLDEFSASSFGSKTNVNRLSFNYNGGSPSSLHILSNSPLPILRSESTPALIGNSNRKSINGSQPSPLSNSLLDINDLHSSGAQLQSQQQGSNGYIPQRDVFNSKDLRDYAINNLVSANSSNNGININSNNDNNNSNYIDNGGYIGNLSYDFEFSNSIGHNPSPVSFRSVNNGNSNSNIDNLNMNMNHMNSLSSAHGKSFSAHPLSVNQSLHYNGSPSVSTIHSANGSMSANYGNQNQHPNLQHQHPLQHQHQHHLHQHSDDLTNSFNKLSIDSVYSRDPNNVHDDPYRSDLINGVNSQNMTMGYNNVNPSGSIVSPHGYGNEYSQVHQQSQLRDGSQQQHQHQHQQHQHHQQQQQKQSAHQDQQQKQMTMMLSSVSTDPHVLVDKIVRTNDQPASLLLQQQLRFADDPSRDIIFNAIIEQTINLTKNRFGNFLMQRVLEYGSDEQVQTVVREMKGSIVNLSHDRFGCHVIQKTLELTDDETRMKVVDELFPVIRETVMHKFSCHVWQRIFQIKWNQNRVPAIIMEQMHKDMGTIWEKVASDENGSLVVQCIFENATEEERRPILNSILSRTVEIALGQWGNWVIQHILEQGAPKDRNIVVKSLIDHFYQMSIDQYASKVVEKALKTSSKPELDEMINKVLFPSEETQGRPPLLNMMNNQFANYVVQHILHLSDPIQKDLCVRLILPHVGTLKNSKYGQRVATLTEKYARQSVQFAANQQNIQQINSMNHQRVSRRSVGPPGSNNSYN